MLSRRYVSCWVKEVRSCGVGSCGLWGWAALELCRERERAREKDDELKSGGVMAAEAKNRMCIVCGSCGSTTYL